MQDLWVLWAAGAGLIGLSMVVKVLMSRFGRREHKTGGGISIPWAFSSRPMSRPGRTS